MDRLRREWKETQIPEAIKLQARNMAWAKMQRSHGGRRIFVWAAAATTIVAVAFLTWLWSGRETSIEQVSPIAPQNASRPAVAADQTTKLLIETAPERKPKPVKRQSAPAQASASVKEPERIVLNFTLPESGARMIWIMDSRFQLEGDDQ